MKLSPVIIIVLSIFATALSSMSTGIDIEETGDGSQATGHEISKTSHWPGLKGYDLEEAKEIIAQERPDLKIIPVHEGSTRMTKEIRMNRVRLFFDKNNKITRAPRVG